MAVCLILLALTVAGTLMWGFYFTATLIHAALVRFGLPQMPQLDPVAQGFAVVLGGLLIPRLAAIASTVTHQTATKWFIRLFLSLVLFALVLHFLRPSESPLLTASAYTALFWFSAFTSSCFWSKIISRQHV